MLIKKLSLSGYNRLFNTGINEITITPTNKITLICGTNGCGKSSLLRELSPLPALSQDYTKKGYKYIEIEHDGKNYSLLSDFGSNHKHSFRVNGEELNISGTLQVQKELVKQHFNLTTEIHELMLGVREFHSMSPKERNDWFNKLCSTDYSFAISFFNKIKEAARDTQGALNIVKSKKIQELSKKENLEKRNSLVLYKTQLEEYLNELMKFNKNNDPLILDKYINEYKSKIKEIKRLSKNIFTLMKANDGNKFYKYDLSKVKEKWIELEKMVSSNEGKIDAYANELNSLLSVQGSDSESNIEARLAQLEKELSTYKKSVYVFSNNETAYTALNSIYDNLVDLLNKILIYDSDGFSRERYGESQEHYNFIVEVNNKLNLDIISLEAKLKTAEMTKNKCPNCNYVWSGSMSKEDIRSSKISLSEKRSIYNDNKARLERLLNYHEECRNYLSYIESISNIMQSTPILEPIWLVTRADKLVSKDPIKLRTILENTRRELEKDLSRDKIVSEINSLKASLDIINKSGIQGISVKDKIKEVEGNISKIYKLQHSLKKELENIRFLEKSFTDINNNKVLLAGYINRASELESKIRDSVDAANISKLISYIKSELDITNAKINEIAVNEQHLKYLEEEEKEHLSNLEICKILNEAMSPKTGLLALGMSGFINDTLRRMNDIIADIWTYPLELLPCNIDEGENLDYRFSIRVGEGHVINDINIGSSGMKEIVDLAFRLVAMLYLGMDEFPVYIDELGASFDERHREMAFKTIRKMSDSDRFSQLFLISHYSECYESLSNIGTVILSDTNISLNDQLITSTCCSIKRD